MDDRAGYHFPNPAPPPCPDLFPSADTLSQTQVQHSPAQKHLDYLWLDRQYADLEIRIPGAEPIKTHAAIVTRFAFTQPVRADGRGLYISLDVTTNVRAVQYLLYAMYRGRMSEELFRRRRDRPMFLATALDVFMLAMALQAWEVALIAVEAYRAKCYDMAGTDHEDVRYLAVMAWYKLSCLLDDPRSFSDVAVDAREPLALMIAAYRRWAGIFLPYNVSARGVHSWQIEPLAYEVVARNVQIPREWLVNTKDQEARRLPLVETWRAVSC